MDVFFKKTQWKLLLQLDLIIQIVLVLLLQCNYYYNNNVSVNHGNGKAVAGLGKILMMSILVPLSVDEHDLC